ncbi:MAG: NUDIX hydrolase [Candidatus Parvarchaeum sp.]
MKTYKPGLLNQLTEKARKEGIERFVVGAVIAINGKVLILRRTKEDFMGGIYELPSGKVEQEETLEQALYREIKEETGLNIKEILSYIKSFDYESASGKKTRQFNFLVVTKEGDIKISEEHDDYKLIGKNEVNSYNITDNVKEVILNAV